MSTYKKWLRLTLLSLTKGFQDNNGFIIAIYVRNTNNVSLLVPEPFTTSVVVFGAIERRIIGFRCGMEKVRVKVQSSVRMFSKKRYLANSITVLTRYQSEVGI